MKSIRLFLYLCAAFILGLFTLLNFHVNVTTSNGHDRQLRSVDLQRPYGPSSLSQFPYEAHQQQQHVLDEYVVQSTVPRRPPSVVVAPWTRVGKTKDGKIAPRAFVFANPEKLMFDDYYNPPTEADKKVHKKIQSDLEKRLCQRSEKLSYKKHDRLKCKRNVAVWHCVTCLELDGMWYSAVSETGGVFGKVSNATSLVMEFPHFKDGPNSFRNLDIAVPISGQDDKLMMFAKRLGPSIKKFRTGLYGSTVSIRLLVTRFPMDVPNLHDATHKSLIEAFQKNLTILSGLRENDIVFVPVIATEFNRAKAINALHREAIHDDETALAMMDVDMSIGAPFLRNALTFPFPRAAAYFPVMWSAYNPEVVALVDKFMPRQSNSIYSEHHGYWRRTSLGMYVIAGSDAPNLLMDEQFVGWGGEDNDFFDRVSKKLNVIRARDTGLTHVWHSKDCTAGGFVGEKFFQACMGALGHVAGSQLGLYLMHLKFTDRATFDEIMTTNKADLGKKDKLPALDYDPPASEESLNILISVVSSRQNFGTRVKSIMETWADPTTAPENVVFRFFVGAPPQEDEFYGKPDEDVANLAKIAGIQDLSTIVVMNDVTDDEYPPVRKNSAMFTHMEKIAQSFEDDTETPLKFQWIYQLDDDAYVNFDGLLSFLKTKHSAVGYHVYGERGYGRDADRKGLFKGGLVKPYCTGGPGYLMSRQTLKDTAPNMMDCVRNADESEYRHYVWHSDSVIGICIYNSTGAGCWDGSEYEKNRVFRHNLKNEDPFPKKSSELQKVIATHPFKDEASMKKQHSRYMEL